MIMYSSESDIHSDKEQAVKQESSLPHVLQKSAGNVIAKWSKNKIEATDSPIKHKVVFIE